jgi:uncharacterized protein YicC (UPF0701 family)
MEMQMEDNALSTEQQVRDVALLMMRICGDIHEALRKASSERQREGSALPYALLTEEYALRSRANILIIEAGRLIRKDLKHAQQAILDTLHASQERIASSDSIQELAELINSLVLFSNALMSKDGNVVAYLLDHLKQSAKFHGPSDTV